jgi:SAM-dependent methyltransferase
MVPGLKARSGHVAKYVWQHDLGDGEEVKRLRLMSGLLDPTSQAQLAKVPVEPDWRCIEIGAGNGSLSQWLAGRLRPPGKVEATDIAADLMRGIESPTLDVAELDVVKDGLPSKACDLVMARALLHQLPERMEVIAAIVDAVRPGGWVFIQEPDFHPTMTVEPESQAQFWRDFLKWAASQQIDYFVGHKVAPRLQELGCEYINVEGHTMQYQGGSAFAEWWRLAIAEVAQRMIDQGGPGKDALDAFFKLNQDPTYWTWTICFTAVTARRPLVPA